VAIFDGCCKTMHCELASEQRLGHVCLWSGHVVVEPLLKELHAVAFSHRMLMYRRLQQVTLAVNPFSYTHDCLGVLMMPTTLGGGTLYTCAMCMVLLLLFWGWCVMLAHRREAAPQHLCHAHLINLWCTLDQSVQGATIQGSTSCEMTAASVQGFSLYCSEPSWWQVDPPLLSCAFAAGLLS
jgi:hypothetical protein